MPSGTLISAIPHAIPLSLTENASPPYNTFLMNIVVTGATGFLGSHLVDSLCGRGDRVTCVIRAASNLRWLERSPVELVMAGPDGKAGPELRRALNEADYVYHLAGAIMGVKKEDYFKPNAGGTRRLLQAMVEAGSRPKRFVYASTLAAVGPGRAGGPITEDQEPRPGNWYGRSKLEAEKITRSHEKHFPYTIVRLPPVYGPRDRGMLQVFQAIRKGFIGILGRGNRTTFLYVSDFVRGMMLAAESAAGAGEIFTIGGKENLSAEDFCRKVARAVGRKTITFRIPMAAVYGAAAAAELVARVRRSPTIFNWQKMGELKHDNWAVDISKARNVLGYESETGIEQGGKITYNWYIMKGWLK